MQSQTMASSKFATMLHKNRTPKIVIILIYTFLEWALISLIFLHGFFSYLIASFANYFGLKSPCVFCSRSYNDLVCDAHAADVLKFCTLESTQKGNLEEEEEDGNLACKEVTIEEIEDERNFIVEDCDASLNMASDESLELITLFGEENRFLGEGERLVPVEIIDSSTLITENKERDSLVEDSDVSLKMIGDESLKLITLMQVENVVLGEEERRVPIELIDSSTLHMNNEEKNFVVEDCDVSSKMVGDECLEHIALMREESRFLSEEERWVPIELIDSSTLSTKKSDQIVHYQGNEKERDYVGYKLDENDDMAVDIGTVEEEKKVAKSRDFGEIQVPQSVCASEQCSSSNNVIVDKEQVIEAEPIRENILRSDNELSICTEFNEVKEEKMPETPTSIDSLHALNKGQYAESLDGSISSETNENEILTVNHLKDALKSERKTLHALYVELEEERRASAISANETMTMITRLQEEKVALKMEVLHYQRMMDEQSEYDQEALELLNELMMKKEKENQELQKELEVYKKKVLEDDSTKSLITVDESLADFEEERLSILEQLKVLENKLFSMDDGDDELKSIEHQHYSNQNDANKNFHHDPRTMVKGGKNLLPLFDATINVESEGRESNGSPQSNSRFVVDDQKRSAIVEDVDNVHERLQALEADKEFLKHCIRSLKKGDKGMDLLQEILQHLRDLRKIEINMNQSFIWK